MKRLLAVAALATAAAVAGCSAGDQVGGPTWQVVALYTEPDTPGALPADAAGKASLAIGETELKGTTGCTPVRAAIDSQDERVRLEQVEFGEQEEGCRGGTALVDGKLKELFTPGAEFEMRRLSDTEMLLTSAGDHIDPPSIRLMSL